MVPLLAGVSRAKSRRFSAGWNKDIAQKALWTAVVVGKWLAGSLDLWLINAPRGELHDVL
jgi:hypothetical protein